jgi:nucleoside-diphosphate-sugar epimerase
MRICLTGASGYLGSRLCLELAKLGHELICVDVLPPKESCGEFRRADLRDEAEVNRAVEGAELLIHCASIHPWKRYTDEQYLDVNVKGTWNLFKSALKHGIRRVILTSSIAASGYDPDPELWPVDESYQHPSLSDIYSLTKLFQEQIARHFCGRRGMRVIALRPPNFTPKPPLQTGASLLSGCLVVEDVVSAHLKALDVWEKLMDNFEPFFITQTFPYSPQETRQLLTDPKGILEKYFPGAWDWFLERGITLNPSPTIHDNSKAKRVLGWQPELTFARWWEENSSNI